MNEFLKFVSRFALFRFDSRLHQQDFGVDARLFQRKTKAVILGRQGVPTYLFRLMQANLFGCQRVRHHDVWNNLQRSVADHGLQFGDHELHLERLAEKAALSRLICIGDRHLT